MRRARISALSVLAAVVFLVCRTGWAQSISRGDNSGTAALRAEAQAYEHGEGLPKDVALAVQLYCEAARRGDAEAQFNLGWIYANGRGVARDDAVAAYFFRLAARQGHEYAERMLRFVGEPVSEMPGCLREKRVAQPQEAPQASGAVTPDPMAEFLPITPAQKKTVELVNKLAPEYGVDPRLALAVIRAESNFHPLARSVKNAQGLMQLIPETAARFNVAKPLDPTQNVRGGLAYLRWLLAYFQGNVTLVAAAYNAGEGAVNRYHGVPPYPETRAYVRRIMEFFGRNYHPYDTTLPDRSPVLSRLRAAIGF